MGKNPSSYYLYEEFMMQSTMFSYVHADSFSLQESWFQSSISEEAGREAYGARGFENGWRLKKHFQYTSMCLSLGMEGKH